MKRVLFVSEIPVFPTNRGNSKRIFNLIEMVKRLGFEVHFLQVGGKARIDKVSYKKYFGKCYHEYMFQTSEQKLSCRIKSSARKIIKKLGLEKRIVIPYTIDECIPKGLDAYVQALDKKWRFNVVISEYIWCSQVLRGFGKDVLKIIDTHDVYANREKLFIDNSLSLSWRYTSNQQEQNALKRADIVMAIQKDEARYFRRILRGTGVKVITIEDYNGSKKLPLCKEKKIGYLATDYSPNKEGIVWFINEAYPLIRSKVPDCRLDVAGSICGQLSDSGSYKKLGYIQDIEEFYQEHRIMIEPVQVGTGRSTKVMEALAYAKPIVVTESGARGHDKGCRYLQVGRDKEEFAQMVMNLLNDDEFLSSYSELIYNMMQQKEKEQLYKLRNMMRYFGQIGS